MRIAIAGGTGTVGRLVTAAVTARGHEPVVLSRSTGIDLVTGEGLDAVLAGADAVIDTSGTQALSAGRVIGFFETVTHNLIAAEQRAGVGHHVALSIVGIDRVPKGFAYYRGKLAQERAVEAAGIPFTIQRATQFHEFAAQMFDRAKLGPIVVVPRMRTQPISAAAVAERLVDLAEGDPAGRVPDIGGPGVERMAELSRRFGRAAHRAGRVLEVPLPGAAGKRFVDGSLLPGPDAQLLGPDFTSWLRAKTGSDGIEVPAASKGIGGITLIRGKIPEPPEPSLSNVEELIAGLRAAGISISLEIEGTPRRLPVRVDETAFRALQEGTSLVLMRVRGQEAHAVVRYLADAVEVEVSHGPGRVDVHGQQATTLERSHAAVRALGGAVASLVSPDGALRVSATIPSP